jgi:hypothetical protein
VRSPVAGRKQHPVVNAAGLIFCDVFIDPKRRPLKPAWRLIIVATWVNDEACLACLFTIL